jgi:hypothetical protein
VALAPTFLRTASPARNAALALVIGLLLSHVAPFDTGNLPGPVRYGYWVGLTLLNWLMVGTILAALGQWRPRLTPPLAGLAAGLLAAIPLTFAVAWLETYLRGLSAPSPLTVLRLYRDVALLAVAIVVPVHLVQGFALARPAPVPAPPSPANGPVAEMSTVATPSLPIPQGGRLLALSAEDHYLRVHSDQGNVLILRRLADAIAELPVDAGRQVHRSHWVAQTAVQGVERNGARLVVVLTNGLRIPVSRTYRLAVQESGWPQVEEVP